MTNEPTVALANVTNEPTDGCDTGTIPEGVTVKGGSVGRPRCLYVFRSAKEHPFAERKATLHPNDHAARVGSGLLIPPSVSDERGKRDERTHFMVKITARLACPLCPLCHLCAQYADNGTEAAVAQRPRGRDVVFRSARQSSRSRRARGSPKSEVRSPKSEVRSPKSEVRNPKSEIRSPRKNILSRSERRHYGNPDPFHRPRKRVLGSFLPREGAATTRSCVLRRKCTCPFRDLPQLVS